MSKTALILLAAGNSSRMGSPKQLLDFHGEPLIRVTARHALEAGYSPVVIVTGALQGEVEEALTGMPVDFVDNPQWELGMGTSIQAGLRALTDPEVNGAILALADQPLVTASFLRSLYAKHVETKIPIVESRYSDTVGVPVFFSREAFPLLMGLRPAQGCKGVILDNQADALLVDCPEAAMDIDTPEDYRKALSLR